MPYYRHGGLMVHMNFSGKLRKNPPKACPFFLWEGKQDENGNVVERVRVRCMQMAPYLCDWPGCDVPICEDHALHLTDELDVCPHHNHVRGLLSRLLPAPEGTTP